jgi:DNA-binding transcriptional ArsR family regulator
MSSKLTKTEVKIEIEDDQGAEICACTVIHEEAVAAVRKALPDEETMLNLADLFKMFADSTRVKVILALLHSELCVCDIAVLLGMTRSAISHQLRLLRQTKLVKTRRDGTVIYYSLDDGHVRNIVAQGLCHVKE